MSKGSEKVTKWRETTKKRIVESFGGECCICGYNKFYGSLALHHINPDEKKFSLSGARANPKSWLKIVNELRKCVLICNNCHAEYHAGLIDHEQIKNAKRFNEDFVDYKSLKIGKLGCSSAR